MTARVGQRYRLRGTEREGLVTSTTDTYAEWAEIVPNWPFPTAPVRVPHADLVRVPMRDHRGEPDFAEDAPL